VPERATAGRVLGGRYRLDRELARGGMATVWIAEDPLLSRRVAVKLLLPELAVDDALRVRFRNEAIAAAKLTHPGIVATYDTGDDDGTAYIVMELVDGMTLRRLIDDRGRLPVHEAVDISSQVADALEHAHRQGLVHRDIKPANVLVQADGRAKVTDFGIAKAAGGDDLTRTGTVVGTARYLAPEQVNGHAVDGRADVYALGLVLYEMLAGRAPFGGDSDMATAVARLTNAPEPIRAARPEVSRPLEDVLARSLARDPEYRYQSAQAFKDALAPGLDMAPTGRLAPPAPPRRPSPPPDGPSPTQVAPSPPRPAPPQPPAGRQARRWPWLLLILLLLVAGGITALVLSNLSSDDSGGGAGPQASGGGVLPIVEASAFDPFVDGEEHSSERRSQHRVANGRLQQPQLRERQAGRRLVGPARRAARHHVGHCHRARGELERRDLRRRPARKHTRCVGAGAGDGRQPPGDTSIRTERARPVRPRVVHATAPVQQAPGR
jgi:serine/threonine protein kinase